MLARRVLEIAAAGALTLALGTSLAIASADDAIRGRQGCMKAHGKTVGELFSMFKGEKAYDNAAVQATLTEMDAACADWDKWWGSDAQKGETLKTWAKPEVWSDPDGFAAAGKAFYDKYLAIKATTDEAGFKATLPEFANTCKGCHERYRRPKE
ncbi:MAG: cytochrome c [Rhizobiales bacterium]|nr:cytochrome c [Hyphomicrobiales bacterium]